MSWLVLEGAHRASLSGSSCCGGVRIQGRPSAGQFVRECQSLRALAVRGLVVYPVFGAWRSVGRCQSLRALCAIIHGRCRRSQRLWRSGQSGEVHWRNVAPDTVRLLKRGKVHDQLCGTGVRMAGVGTPRRLSIQLAFDGCAHHSLRQRKPHHHTLKTIRVSVLSRRVGVRVGVGVGVGVREYNTYNSTQKNNGRQKKTIIQ